MVRRFKNRVKISEVQEEFDKLCKRIDDLNQVITDVQGYGDDFDYSIGSTQLSPSGYTLTLGGLQKALDGADGKVIGAKAFKVDNNHIKMTTGMLITKDGGYQLPDSYLTVPNDKRTLYYNTVTKQYQWTGTGTETQIVPVYKNIGSNMTNITDTDYYILPTFDNNARGYSLENQVGSYYWTNTKSIRKFNEDTNTAELLEQGKCKINIGDYIHVLLNNTLQNNSSIVMNGTTSQGAGGNSNFMILGYLDGDGETFTPKLSFDMDGNGYGTDDSWHVNCGYGDYTLQLTLDNMTLKPDGVSLKFANNVNIALWNSNYGHESLTVNKGLRLTFSKSGDTSSQRVNAELIRYPSDGSYDSEEATYTSYGTYTLPIDIEEYNINCILFRTIYNCERLSDDTHPPAPQLNVNCVNAYTCSVTQNNVTYPLNTSSQELVYYDTVEVPSDIAAYKICELNMNRDSIYANDHLGVQCENIYGTYKIQSESRTYSGDWSYNANGRSNAITGHWHWGRIGNGFIGYEAPNNASAPKFILPIEPSEADDSIRYESYYMDKRIGYNRARYRGTDNWYPVANFFFLPKGAPCPFNYKMQTGGNTWNPAYYNVRTSDPTECSSQKSYNVKISKTLKQKTS